MFIPLARSSVLSSGINRDKDKNSHSLGASGSSHLLMSLVRMYG